MIFSFHPEAQAEFSKAIDYYEERETGLGYDFAIEVFAGIRNIANHPAAWPVIEEDIRRYLVNRFPYGILYSIEQNEIFILAVMSLSRHPDSWKDRR